jgi:hypothetical protein
MMTSKFTDSSKIQITKSNVYCKYIKISGFFFYFRVCWQFCNVVLPIHTTQKLCDKQQSQFRPCNITHIPQKYPNVCYP